MDFETYARLKPMDGNVAHNWREVFDNKVLASLNPRQAKVLDYGFGDGKYYTLFSEIFRKENIYGLEISKLRISRARALGWHQVQRLKDKEAFPFEENYFDFINCDQMIEHIKSKDVDFYLAEMARVLNRTE